MYSTIAKDFFLEYFLRVLQEFCHLSVKGDHEKRHTVFLLTTCSNKPMGKCSSPGHLKSNHEQDLSTLKLLRNRKRSRL